MTSSIARLAALAALAVSACAQPIQLHPKNPHYFLFRGKAVALVTSGEHYGAVLNGTFDYRKYLDTLAADRLNYTRLFGGSYIEQPAQSFGIKRNDLAPDPGHYIAPWARAADGKLDLTKWSPEYFARFHDFLAEASKRGIVVEISLFSSHYGEMQWKLSPFNPANNVNGTNPIDYKRLETLENGNILAYQESYARKLVAEANGFDNVFFEIQNEPWSDRTKLADVVNPYLRPPDRDQYPNSIDVADELSIAWQTRVAQWIMSEEAKLPNKHLIAQNYCNFYFPVRELAPGVSIVNFHYAYPAAVTLNYGLGKALAYDETGFIGRDDATYRRQAWNFMLSGGSTFDNLDYSFNVGHEDGSDGEPNGPGGGSTAFRTQLRVLVDFLAGLPLVDMTPDAHVVKRAGGAYARVLSKPGSVYAMYFDGTGPMDVTLDLPAGTYACEWINIDKEEPAIATDYLQGGIGTLHSPAFRDGIALRVTAVRAD